MKTLNPFLPTSGNPAIVPSQLTRAGGTLYLVNQSNANYLIDFQNGNTATLLAQHARPYKLRFPLNSFVVSVQSLILAAPVQNPQIWGEAFDAGEDTGPLFSGPLTNDIAALGQPTVTDFGNVNNTTFTLSVPVGKQLYLLALFISMDKAATPSSGLLTINNFDTSIVPTGSLEYQLVQSAQQSNLERKYTSALPAAAGKGLQFVFPNLADAIYLEVASFTQ